MGARASHCFLKDNLVEGEPVSKEVQGTKAEAEEKNVQAAEVAKKKKEEAAEQAKAAAEAKAEEEKKKKKKAAEKAADEKKEETNDRVSTTPPEKQSTDASETEPEGPVTLPISSNVPPPRPPTVPILTLPARKAPEPEVPTFSNAVEEPESAALQAPAEAPAASAVEKLEAEICQRHKLQTEDHVEAASTAGKVEENNLPKEKRVNPVDRKTYTFEEISKQYKSQYNAAEIQAYWEKECKLMKANESKPANQRNNQNKKKKAKN